MAQVFYGGHVVDDFDRRVINTYLDALVRHELLPANLEQAVASATAAAATTAGLRAPPGPASSAAQLEQPALELAPGFRRPPPTDYDSMRAFIESFPPDAPPLYAMHGNAQLSLLNGQTEAVFQAILEVAGPSLAAAAAAAGGAASGPTAGASAGGGGGGGSAGGGEAAVRATLADLLGRLPLLFTMESRVEEKTPFVVVALQVGACGGPALSGCMRDAARLPARLDEHLSWLRIALPHITLPRKPTA